MMSEAQSCDCCKCRDELGRFLALAADLVITLSARIDQVDQLAELQKFVLTRYSQRMLEADIFEELRKYEAEQKRKARKQPGGFPI